MTVPYVVVASLFGLEVVAQAALPDLSGWIQLFLQAGVSGYIIWWFSTRMEKTIDELRRALDRNNRARMLELSLHRLAPADLREEAKTIVAEVDKENKTDL